MFHAAFASLSASNDRASIEEMLAAAGLALCDVWADLCGTPVTDEADTYGVLARRRNGADG
ncbi:MAG: hypothetical protein ABEI76_08280 [Halobacteriales archaeon]